MKYITLTIALFAACPAMAANLITPVIFLDNDNIFRFQHDETANGYNVYQNNVYIDTVIGESFIVQPISGNDYYIVGFDNAGNFSQRSNTISFVSTALPVTPAQEVCVTTTVTVGGAQRGAVTTHCY